MSAVCVYKPELSNIRAMISLIQSDKFHCLQNSRPTCRSTISSNLQENGQVRNLQEDPQAQVGYKELARIQYYIKVTLYTKKRAVVISIIFLLVLCSGEDVCSLAQRNF